MISGLPFQSDVTLYIFLISFLLGAVALVLLLLYFLIGAVEALAGNKGKRVSLTQNGFWLILIILWLFLSASGLLLTALVQSYRSFTKKELIAVVRCTPSDSRIGDMRMELHLVSDGKIEQTREFMINGDQWSIEGDILKWDDRLNFAGLHTMYNLTRVRGRYIRTADEIQNRATVYSLVENEEEPGWRWLYEYGHKLPFVTAVYGNTIFTYPSERKTYDIYVTTSGFMAEVSQE